MIKIQKETDLQAYWLEMAKNAKKASQILATLGTKEKNNALSLIAKQITTNEDSVLKANDLDLRTAEENKLSSASLERLKLTPSRIKEMTASVEEVIALADPVGGITDLHYRPSGIQLGKYRTPLGVVGIIYESRPNVTIDAASLCFKSGNSSILRGGKEAINSNLAIMDCIKNGLTQAKLDSTLIQFLPFPDRKLVTMMLHSPEWIDVIIPRGGEGLIKAIVEESKVPVIKHFNGICHVYIDEYADNAMASNISVNSKTRRYGVCNALESLLIHEKKAGELLPLLKKQFDEKKVQLKGCVKTTQIIPVEEATEEDWRTEYLDAILSIKIVSNIEEAIKHINHYGSGHTDAIISHYLPNTQRFLQAVDSSSVMINASTSFADGFEYGLGAEIGISTDKLHVRGPVGLEGLTTQKYIVFGKGEVRP